MKLADRLRQLLAWTLALQLIATPNGARAAATDGSTLATNRGAAPTGAPSAADLSTDLFSGAATQRLTIELPPGTGGLTPALALGYTSASRSDSWVGYGWSLGLSSISRSLTHGVPAYNDATDVFELDGQPLVLDATQTTTAVPPLPTDRYHTRRESFLRVIHNTPMDTWTVTTKGGTKLRYGLSDNARVQKAAGQTYAWMLPEEEDLHGNVITVTYDRSDAGTAYPLEIRYTLRRQAGGGLASLGGSAANDRVVHFTLEARPDTPVSFAAGFLRRLGQRLKWIDVSAAGAELRRYELRYEQSADSLRSLLSAVALYGSDATAETPTAPLVTAFSYHSNVAASTTGWASAPWPWPANLALVNAANQDNGVRLVDVDGDGRPDLLKAYSVQTSPDLATTGYVFSGDTGAYLNDGAGFSATASSLFVIPTQTIPSGTFPVAFATQLGSDSLGTGIEAMDLTGDGRADLIGEFRDLNPSTGVRSNMFLPKWYQGSATGFQPVDVSPALAVDTFWSLARYGITTLTTTPSGGIAYSFGWIGGNTRFADLTGDGLPELVTRGVEESAALGGLPPGVGVGWWKTSCETQQMLTLFYNVGSLQFSAAPSSPAGAVTWGCALAASRASSDFQACDPSDSACVYSAIYSITGRDYFVAAPLWNWFFDFESGALDVDVNGDGLADLLGSAALLNSSYPPTTLLNNGARGYENAPAWAFPAAPRLRGPNSLSTTDLGVRLADVNGDGRPDTMQSTQVPGYGAAAWINRGYVDSSPTATPWLATTDWALPDGIAFTSPSGQDLGVRLVDIDGDGMVDLVNVGGSSPAVYLNRGKVPDLLVGVTTSLGGGSTFEYTPSTRFDNTSSGMAQLPQVLQLVTAVSISDGSATAPSRTTISYAGGKFDAPRRELRGFREVTTTGPDGRRTVTAFLQDVSNAGLVASLERYDSGGVLWNQVDNAYSTAAANPPYVVLPTTSLHSEFDGQATARVSRTLLSHDAYGNVTAQQEDGEVNSSLQDLIPSDTRTTQASYLYVDPADGSESYLVDRPNRKWLVQGGPASTTVLRDTRFFYDGDTSGTASPTRGLLTKRSVLGLVAGQPDAVTQLEYNTADGVYGNVTSITDPNGTAGAGGGMTTIVYDATFHAFQASVTNPLGHQVRFDYAGAACSTPYAAYPAGAGLVQLETGPNDATGAGTLRCFDVFGRVRLDRAPGTLAETTTTYTIVPGGEIVNRYELATSGGGRRNVTTVLDGLGRVTFTQYNNGPQGKVILEARRYDSSGRISTTQGPSFSSDLPATTTYDYDALDRVTSTSLPVDPAVPGMNRTTLASYVRGLATITDPNGNVVKRQVDPFGNVVRVTESDGTQDLVTSYRYDVANRLFQVTDAKSNVTTVLHDGVGRKYQISDPDSGTTTFTHDPNGNTRTRTSVATGSVVTYDYDALNRPLSRVQGADTATWTYDLALGGKGLVHTRTDAGGVFRAGSYDLRGQLLTETQTVAGATLSFSTGYDPLGQVTSRTLPTRTVTWGHDAAGYLTTISSGATSYATGIQWDASGRLAKWTAANGVTSTTAFNPSTTRLDSLAITPSSGPALESLSYGFDNGDRLISITGTGGGQSLNQSFGYDGVSRLETATGPYGAALASQTYNYAYDEIGNLTCKDATAASPTSCTPGSAGSTLSYPTAYSASHPVHAPATVNGLPVGYDGLGNLTSLMIGGTPRAYTYDTLGRLRTVTDAGALKATYTFDGNDRRVTVVDTSGPRPSVTRRFVRPDFEWESTRRLGKVHVSLGGTSIATVTDPFAPPGATGSLAPARPRGDSPFSSVLLLGPLAAGGLLLAFQLAQLRRRRISLLRPGLAGTTLLAFVMTLVPTHALALPPLPHDVNGLPIPNGDLNADGRLDAADALLEQQIAAGKRVPTPDQLDRGDLAPVNLAPKTPHAIVAGDVALLLRAIRGDDVDQDLLTTDEEMAAGSSPFRLDSDRDSLNDFQEIRVLGSNPSSADTDGDGLLDAAEVNTQGTDPTDSDTDGDGFTDGAEIAAGTNPLAGVVYRHGDHLGSTAVVTRSDGQVIQRVVYKPFGGLNVAEGPDATKRLGFYFTGQRFESAVGIYDYGARFYDPALGRFLQPDSVAPSPYASQSLNRYSYVRNNPLGRIDPSGNWDLAGAWGGVTSFFGGIGGSISNGYSSLGSFFTGSDGGFSLQGLSNPIRQYLPGIVAAPLGGILDALGGIGQSLAGVATFNPAQIGAGARNAGLGLLGSIGLKEAITENWVSGPTGGLLPQSVSNVVQGVGDRVPKDAGLNGMHAWHAGTNAAIAGRLGPGAGPAQILGGIYHETPLDRDSFWQEQDFQGSINHLLDSLMDIGSNVVGQAMGYLLPPVLSTGAAMSVGNQIPGPADPDAHFGGRGQRYTGDPADAWGPYR